MNYLNNKLRSKLKILNNKLLTNQKKRNINLTLIRALFQKLPHSLLNYLLMNYQWKTQYLLATLLHKYKKMYIKKFLINKYHFHIVMNICANLKN